MDRPACTDPARVRSPPASGATPTTGPRAGSVSASQAEPHAQARVDRLAAEEADPAAPEREVGGELEVDAEKGHVEDLQAATRAEEGDDRVLDLDGERDPAIERERRDRRA